MRALTVRQPWAWAIVHGGKTVENRTRNLAGSYRGPIAIHAGLNFELTALDHPAFQAAVPRDGEQAKAAFDARHLRGLIIGVAELVDVHTCHHVGAAFGSGECCQPWGEHEYVEERRMCEPEGRQIGLILHLVLANPRPLPEPVPAKGRLGLWTPDPDLLEAIELQLTTTPGGTR